MVEIKILMRRVAAAPGVYLTAVASLAAGLGAVIGVLGIVDGTFLRPLPGVAASGLAAVQNTNATSKAYSFRQSQTLGERPDLFAGVARFGWVLGDRTVHVSEANVRAVAVMVSAGYFETLGVRMAAGRAFTAPDHTVDEPSAAILSYAFWRAGFGGERSILGRRLTIGGVPVVVVGVTARGFRGTDVSKHPDVYLPLELAPRVNPALPGIDWLGFRSPAWLHVVARLRPGMSVQSANAALAAWAERESDRTTRTIVSFSRVVELQRSAIPARLADEFRRLVLLFGWTALAILLVGSVTVGTIFLVRGEARWREQAVRLALGASRGRLIMTMWLESLACCAAGAVLALPIAYALPRAAAVLAPRSGPIFDHVGPPFSLRAFASAMACASVASVLVTFIAHRSRAAAPAGVALQGGAFSAPVSRHWTRHLIVAAQVTLAMALLCNALLFARSLAAVYRVDVGYDTKNLVEAAVDVVAVRLTDNERIGLYDEIEQALRRSLPSARIGRRELESVVFGSPRAAGARAGTPADRTPTIVVLPVSSGYLETLGLPLLEGRTLIRRDNAVGPAVAVVTASLAQRLARDRSALGSRVDVGTGQTGSVVVGVVGNTRLDALGAESLTAFVPAAAGPGGGTPADSERIPRQTTFVIRTNQVALVSQILRNAVGRWPAASVSVRRTTERFAREAAVQRLGLAAFGLVAVVATVLAMLSLYAVIASTITRSTKDTGIRIALGAPVRAIATALGGDVLLPVAGGLLAGGIVTSVSRRLLQGLLFGVEPADPASAVGAAVLLLTVAVLILLPPILRATRSSPSQMLRHP